MYLSSRKKNNIKQNLTKIYNRIRSLPKKIVHHHDEPVIIEFVQLEAQKLPDIIPITPNLIPLENYQPPRPDDDMSEC